MANLDLNSALKEITLCCWKKNRTNPRNKLFALTVLQCCLVVRNQEKKTKNKYLHFCFHTDFQKLKTLKLQSNFFYCVSLITTSFLQIQIMENRPIKDLTVPNLKRKGTYNFLNLER